MCGFNHVEGSSDCTSLILNDLEQWGWRDTSGRWTMARYVLDEAVEEALYATYSPGPRDDLRPWFIEGVGPGPKP